MLRPPPTSPLFPYTTLFRSDDAIIEHLVQVKGIGRWTVQMFLMFRLGRPDVLPELDLGVQNAIQRAYGLRDRNSTRLNSSHMSNSYAVCCLKKKNHEQSTRQ